MKNRNILFVILIIVLLIFLFHLFCKSTIEHFAAIKMTTKNAISKKVISIKEPAKKIVVLLCLKIT